MFVCRHGEHDPGSAGEQVNSQSLTRWTPLTYLPLCSFPHFPCALPTFLVLVHNHHSLNTCPVCPHFAGFTPDVPFVGHLCQMKFTFFQVQLKCPLSGNPSQSSPSKISLVPSELPQPPSYTSVPASAAYCTLFYVSASPTREQIEADPCEMPCAGTGSTSEEGAQ